MTAAVLDRTEKNKAIAASLKATRERRKSQTCKVFELKVQYNKLSVTQREALFMLFVEAKWLYNDCLSSELDPWNYKPGTTVTVKNKDGEFEKRTLNHLGSQMKQSVIAGITSSIRTLSSLKRKGKKVGSLRFLSQYTSLDLKQHGTTYRFRGSKVKVQNVPGWIRVHGVQQLDGYELANAKLINKPDGYYLKVTAFIDNENVVPQVFDHNSVIGIDMGVKTHITTSNGDEINVTVGETDRLKRLQRKLSRQESGSNNRNKTRRLIGVEYQKMDRKKDELANQVVHELLNNEVVVFQDDNISGWKNRKGFVKAGKKLQHSVLGRVKSKLKRHPRTVMLGRFEPTTQRCECGAKTKHSLDQREFVCSVCGFTEHRDEHAARMMIVIASENGALPEHVSTSGLEGINACGDCVRRF